MGLQKPRLLQELTPRLVRVYMLCSIGAMNFGFDNNWWGSVIGMQSFRDQYGRIESPGQPKTLPSTWISAASGTPIAGWIIGCFMAGLITRSLGRKRTIWVICGIAIVGIILQCAIPSYWGIMVGRLINSISMGLESNTVPVYMSELAPAGIRGALVNFYEASLMVGAIIATGTVYGTSVHLTGVWTYKTVMVVQIFIPIALAIAVNFIPESPRWLLSQDRREEALKALEFMRHGTASPEKIQLELSLMEQANIERQQTVEGSGFLDCFKGTNGYRTFIAIGVQALQQSQGNSFTTTFLVTFLEQLGVTNSLLISCANMCMCFAGTLFAFYLTDRIGRRWMLIVGAFFMAALMWIVSGMAAWLPGGVQGVSAQGCVAALLIYSIFSTGCWGSVMWTLTAEIGTNQLRERTISIATIAGFIASLLITYINPYVQDSPGNLGSRVGLVYGSISILSMFFVYFLVPETSGRSLEELDELFEARVPAWKSTSFRATGIGATITSVENMVPKGSVTAREKLQYVLQGVEAEGGTNDVEKAINKEADSSAKF
ncbi:uncharacterized protein N7459_005502 [Penicillium hispanicum]|uniref:uncharacterized protein n=1 Tax=Penicillium hispanicum TaxID=1080232 RepID=UPI0025426A30|nr:uncharacterized protein N7459_005502 [Penicillium hispanicum]KAJ5579517.1 hypothetical protein N7459_005502 [Penicillium hispanicum]